MASEIAERARAAAEAALRKDYGSDKVPGAGGFKTLGFMPWGISTQSLMLDLAIGRPGIPGGRMTQVIGLDGHGKTTLVMAIAAEALQIGAVVALQDVEGAYEDDRLKKLGVNPEQIMPLVPDSLEDLHGMTQDAIKNVRKVDKDVPMLVVFDTPDGIHAKAGMDADTEDSLPAIDARVNGVQVPRTANLAAKHKVAIVVVQQVRKVWVKGFQPKWIPDQYDTKGGHDWKYRASLRLEVKRGEIAKDKESMSTKIKVLKNKLAPPFKEAIYELDFDTGIDKWTDLWRACQELGVVKNGIFRYKKVNERVSTSDFVELIKTKYGGPDKFRRRMLKRACAKGYIKPYGVINDDPPAESDAEQEASG